MHTQLFEWGYATLDDRRHCRRAIRQGSKSFFAASIILPADLRDPAYAVYAFCRMADDNVDLGNSQGDAIARLKGRLDAVYDRTPMDHPCDRALTDVVVRFNVPRALFDALIQGLEWDETGQSYETIDDLQAYAARVASAVGAIMTCLMGRRASSTLARACDLGVAMQLTNIARDVGEDARAGRVYLPHAWLREAGLQPADLIAEPAMTPALASVIQRLLEHADPLYLRAASGIADLPASCRPAINAARRLYASIGDAVAANGYDSVNQRAVVPTRRKLFIAAHAALEAVFLDARAQDPALAATRFLVQAVVDHPTGAEAGESVDSRTEWVILLFERLAERERVRNAGIV